MAGVEVSAARINDREFSGAGLALEVEAAGRTGEAVFDEWICASRAKMDSLLSLALLAFEGDGFEQGLYFGSFSSCYAGESFLSAIFVFGDERSSFGVDFLTIGVEDLCYRAAIREVRVCRYMEDAPVGEDEECSFNDKYNSAGQELFAEGNGRTAGCDLEYFLILLEKGQEERYFLQELSLSFFDSGLVDVLVVGEQDVGVRGKVYRKLIILVD